MDRAPVRSRRRGRSRPRRSQGLPPGRLAQIIGTVSGVVAVVAGAGLWALGVAGGTCVLVFAGVFVVGTTIGHLVDNARTARRVERYLEAGETDAARRLLERAAGNRSSSSRTLALARKVEAAGNPAPPPPEPPPHDSKSVTSESADALGGAVAPNAPVAGRRAHAPGPRTARSTRTRPPPEPPPPPIPPILTRKGVAVVALLVPAFLPVVGIPAGIALLVVSILLLASRDRREWDPPVAKLGIVIGFLSAVTNVLFVLSVVFQRGSREIMPKLNVASVPDIVLVVEYTVLFLSIVLHECAHGAAARISGDETAYRRGRLTLNPLKHVDLFGSVLLPGILVLTHAGVVFGWAKPVPVRRESYRHSRRGDLFVSSAGVLTNLLIALLSGALLLSVGFVLSRGFPGAVIHDFAAPFSLTSISGVPGAPAIVIFVEALKAGVLVNLLLVALNVLPIPPLDGFHLLRDAFPGSGVKLTRILTPIGLVLLGVLFFTHAFSFVAIPAVIGGIILFFLSHILFGF